VPLTQHIYALILAMFFNLLLNFRAMPKNDRYRSRKTKPYSEWLSRLA